MINLSSISKTCLMIHLSSPATKNLCHILKSNRAPRPLWFIQETKAKRLLSLFHQLRLSPIISYHWFLFLCSSFGRKYSSAFWHSMPKDSWQLIWIFAFSASHRRSFRWTSKSLQLPGSSRKLRLPLRLYFPGYVMTPWNKESQMCISHSNPALMPTAKFPHVFQ